MITKKEATELLDGYINNPANDDLHHERDRLLRLVSDLNLDTRKYRKVVSALKAANDTIEKIKLAL